MLMRCKLSERSDDELVLVHDVEYSGIGREPGEERVSSRW